MADGEFPLCCDRCQSLLRPGHGEFYVVQIEAVLDPSPPEFTEEELAQDHRAEMESVLLDLSEYSERELLDQVRRSLTLHLCLRCFPEWIENPAGDGGPR